MLDQLIIGVSAALVGVVYAHVLPDDPTPLSKWFAWLSKMAETPKKKWLVWHQWFAYPIGYCPVCCSGQIALWSYLFSHGFRWNNVPLAFVTAAIAILLAPVLIKLNEWSRK
jgi:hypothetical protein